MYPVNHLFTYTCVHRYPPLLHPVLAFKGAPASFPVKREHRQLQRYVRWSDRMEEQAKAYISGWEQTGYVQCISTIYSGRFQEVQFSQIATLCLWHLCMGSIFMDVHEHASKCTYIVKHAYFIKVNWTPWKFPTIIFFIYGTALYIYLEALARNKSYVKACYESMIIYDQRPSVFL